MMMLDKLFNEFEKIYKKPIYLVNLFSVLIMTEISLTVFFNISFFDFIKNFKISYEANIFQFVVIFVFCIVLKIFVGVICRYLFLYFGNDQIYNNKMISKSLDSWLQIAYQKNNLFAIEKLKKYKESINLQKDYFCDVVLHIILSVFYFFLSICNKTVLASFIFSNRIVFLFGCYYIILIITIISFFSKKDKYLIDLE